MRTERERALFRELIKVSGVGPRIALAILSGVSVDAFHHCIESEDVASLVRVPGIGRKTAERLVIEMRDRLKGIGGAPPGGGSGLPAGTAPSPQAEAFSALVALGYKPAEVTPTAAEGRSCRDFDRRDDPSRTARGGGLSRGGAA